MRCLLLFAMCLMGTLAAETIGNVEYFLPASKTWKKCKPEEICSSKGCKLIKEGETAKSTTLFYIPENAEWAKADEYFAACSCKIPNRETDKSSIEKMLQQLFPGQKINVKMIEQDSKSFLFEWSKGEGQEILFTLTRSFSTEMGSVTLMYQTENKKHFDNNKKEWIKALKAAKLKT